MSEGSVQRSLLNTPPSQLLINIQTTSKRSPCLQPARLCLLLRVLLACSGPCAGSCWRSTERLLPPQPEPAHSPPSSMQTAPTFLALPSVALLPPDSQHVPLLLLQVSQPSYGQHEWAESGVGEIESTSGWAQAWASGQLQWGSS